MAQIEVQIVRDENDVVSFQPTPRTVTSLDILFWSNYDEVAAHQPAPTDQNGNVIDPNAWMSYAIPLKERGEDAPTSRGMTFDPPTGSTPYSVSYACAKHPTTEKGVITVNS